MFMRELASNMDMIMFEPEDVIRLMDAPTIMSNFYRPSKEKVDWHRETVRTKVSSFYGDLDYDACRAAMYGEYKYGAERLDGAIASIVTKRQFKHTVSSVVGCSPNVAAYLSGRPNSMWNIELKEVPSKATRVLLFGDWYAADSAETIMRACERVTPYIIGLELSGVQCEVFMASATLFPYSGRNRNRDNISFFELIKVKAFGQRMNTGRTAFMCGTPSFYRRVKFNMFFSFEGYTAKGGKFGVSGYASPISESELKNFFRFEDIPELQGARTINLRELAYQTDESYPSYIKSRLCC